MSVSTSPRKVNQGVSSRASEMHQTGKTAIVKSLSEDEVIRLSSGRPSCTLPTIRKASVGSKNDSSSVSSLIPNSNPRDSSTKVLGKHPRNDEIHNKPMTSKHASCSLSSKGVEIGPTKECTGENQQPLGGVIIDKNVQIHYPGKEQPTNRASFEALSTRKSFTFPVLNMFYVRCMLPMCNMGSPLLRRLSDDSRIGLELLADSLSWFVV
ncbi:unnamed protein product [Sphenostylis stenocarpa]|uniref:Uncharacterized protein n=1 Tax=Sphenostylis stenocarpa TaxID=92480 RepID=A0AA86T7N3_9FABA|nr:unnamed protein product [Sphenostylis stenocarpa]